MLERPVADLSHGLKQSLELAMVVALEPRLILLDEPTAGLTKTERTTIGGILQKLTRELGIAAIVVEHDLDFVRTISSRVVCCIRAAWCSMAPSRRSPIRAGQDDLFGRRSWLMPRPSCRSKR